MSKALKVKPVQLPLTQQAGRIALLCGISAGTVTRPELEAAIVQDTVKRSYRKPVVAYGVRFDSVTDAAVYYIQQTSGWIRPTGLEYAHRLDTTKHRITRLCNGDKTEGFYWSE